MPARGGQGPTLRGAESLRGVPARQGQGPFLFLRKKKRAFTPRRRKVRTTPFPPYGENSVPLPCASSPHKSCAFVGPPGPVFGEFGVEHGGLRLYALFGDQPRPLRPSHSGTGKRIVVLSNCRLAVPLSWQSTVVHLGRHALYKFPAPPQGKHPTESDWASPLRRKRSTLPPRP